MERGTSYAIVYIYDTGDSPIGFQYRETSYAAGVWDGNSVGGIIGITASKTSTLASFNIIDTAKSVWEEVKSWFQWLQR